MVSVRRSATTGYICLQPQPSLFKQLQKETLPWKAPGRSLLIGDSCLDECESLELWASYLQSLTSWEGPVLPETLWQQHACGHAPPELVRPNQVDTAAKHAKAWLTESSLHTMASDTWSSVFTWSELCEALCSMNPSAAVPQSEPIPSSLLHCPCEVFRSLVLVFVSFAWILSKCPTHWLCATVIPLHKAGKTRRCADIVQANLHSAILVQNCGPLVVSASLATHSEANLSLAAWRCPGYRYGFCFIP